MMDLAGLQSAIQFCMAKDKGKLFRDLTTLRSRQKQNKPIDRLLQTVLKRVEESQTQVRGRLELFPVISFPEQLPIAEKRQDIADALQRSQVVIVAGETGSGKTTQLAKICLSLGRGLCGQIGHTQPRRLAARTVANRIAEELNTPLGDKVGYQVRFQDISHQNTLVRLMTDGILLAEIPHDPLLSRYDTLIIDEAHERSLNIDFIMGYLKRILPKRPDLKVVITSATIDVERFSKHFNNAPIVEVSGRTYPVELLYRPLTDQSSDDDNNDQELVLQRHILEAIEEIIRLERGPNNAYKAGDILIFLSGEREIREVAKYLRDAALTHTEVLPLYARLSQSEQQRIFQSHRGRRVVLATNVAETSLTVPGIRYVIDPGQARISRYSYRSKVQRLPIEAISQASANQRKGRCGRLSEGVCIRLYSEEDFQSRPEFTDAEIRRTNLAAVILQMLSLKLGDIEQFPFVDAPDSRFIKDGFLLLHELGAVGKNQQLNELGRKLSRLPIDPRLGRMVITAAEKGCLREVLIVVSALSAQDPRERPQDKQQAADEKHREYQHEESDFLSFVNLWDFYEEQRQELSQNQLRRYCKKRYLSYMRMREWRELHHQLHLACKQLGFTENAEPASYVQIHSALASGLLSYIGNKLENKEYLGARNRKFFIHPSSGQFKKQPRWLMAAELVETSRLFARQIAKIEPQWLEPLAKHLSKVHYSEPHWEKKREQVVAFERVSLYGLPIVSKRRVHYGPIDPKVSREVFIRQGLIEQQLNQGGKVLQDNQGLISQAVALEDKVRRRDILVDEEKLYEFYAMRLPEDIVGGISFKKWMKSLAKQQSTQPHPLALTFADITQRDIDSIAEHDFPDTWRWQGMALPLRYCFDPQHDRDGITMRVPLSVLPQLPAGRLQWLVPGYLGEKIAALLKALPKAKRKVLVPLPNTVSWLLKNLMVEEQPLTRVLAAKIFQKFSIKIEDDEWQLAHLDDHLHFNFHVYDEDNRLVGEGRDIERLQLNLADLASESRRTLPENTLEQTELTDWSFDELPASYQIEQQGVTLTAYPGLFDLGKTVQLKLFDQEGFANHQSSFGIARLILLQHPEQLRYGRQKLPQRDRLQLLFRDLFKPDQLLDHMLLAATVQNFQLDGDNLPRSREAFEARLADKKGEWMQVLFDLAELLVDIGQRRQALKTQLKGKFSLQMAMTFADVKNQLDHLFFRQFISRTPEKWLRQYPRYLKGIEQRVQKAAQKPQKEQVHVKALENYWQHYLERQQYQDKSLRYDPNLARYRWLLEELRVSWFAQSLGTTASVSTQKLDKLWGEIMRG